MCTAATFKTKDLYFGRTLDHNCSYGESVFTATSGFDFNFRRTENAPSLYSIMGVAHVRDGYPLYYDGINSEGLCMAGLNFPGNAHYAKPSDDKNCVAVFELIPWILGYCASVSEARMRLSRAVIADIPFCDGLPSAELHWIIADKDACITVEQTARGLSIYDNPVGVLANNPPFEYHLHAIENYLNLTPNQPVNRFSQSLELKPCSLGMGAIGLPGDWSSQSRFVRCSFVKENIVCGDSEDESVSAFFDILGSVNQVRGCSRLPDSSFEYTLYTVCYNASRGICYYRYALSEERSTVLLSLKRK